MGEAQEDPTAGTEPAQVKSTNRKETTPLKRLLRDLQTKRTLCHLSDYNGTSLEELNQYLRLNGPIASHFFGLLANLM